MSETMSEYEDKSDMSEYDNMFTSLFYGNCTAVGTEEGGCERIGHPSSSPTKWWMDKVQMHLQYGGPHAIGVYPIVNNHVKWACIDWDEGDEISWGHARNVQQALDEFGVPMYIERSRSKGYHGWVFFTEWVPIEPVRKALIVACQIVDAPHREVNPKQFKLADGQLGNYVRLPYPGRRLRPDGRRNIITSLPLNYEAAVRAMWAGRIEVEMLQPLVDMWVDPDPPVFAPRFIADTNTDMHSRMDGFSYTVWRDGPRPGDDRSEQLWKLAKSIADHGKHTQSEAVQLLIEADTRWGAMHPKGPKFVGRPDGATQITNIVNKAWR